jgi:trk system potassium uptake protein TrkA
MKKKICIIGISSFGEQSLKMLLNMNTELVIIDKNKEVIQKFKDVVSDAYIIDVINFESVKKVIPKKLDIAIIDLGKRIEASILITNYLKSIDIPMIIARADSDQHGEILDMVGATKVIYPNQEAVQRIIPRIISNTLLNYIPINDEIIILEVTIPKHKVGQNAIDLDLRNKFNINIIALKNNDEGKYKLFDAQYRFCKDDKALIVGNEVDIMKFLDIYDFEPRKNTHWNIKKLFTLFNKQKKNI